jgi:hypothetical protein
MLRNSTALKDFLNFSHTISDETRDKLLAISDAHPIIKNHPVMQRLVNDKQAFISISAITSINETILKHSIKLARQAASGDKDACLRALMEQNVLTVASVVLHSLMTEQLENSIQRLATIKETASFHKSKFLDTINANIEIDYLKELEKEADNEMLEAGGE